MQLKRQVLLLLIIVLIYGLNEGCLMAQDSIVSFKTTINKKWTVQQLEKANTAATIDFLTREERETILYLNLARLYPKKFVSIEVENYTGGERFGYFARASPFKASLIKTLNSLSSMSALVFDTAAY